LLEDVMKFHTAMIDKDRNPKWSLSTPEDGAPESLEAFFAARDERLFG
jgi:enoyl-CoA hydratase